MVPLGKTGLKVSRIGMGTGMSGSNRESNQTRLGKEKFTALLKEGYARGVRMFDMADLYGSMPYVGPALKDVRDKCIFNTKIWVMAAAFLSPSGPTRRSSSTGSAKSFRRLHRRRDPPLPVGRQLARPAEEVHGQHGEAEGKGHYQGLWRLGPFRDA